MKKMIISVVCLLFSFQSLADIRVTAKVSQDIWDAVSIVGVIQDLPIIKNDVDKELFELDKMECVFDEYEACSFFSDINGLRKLIVSIEGSTALINGLGRAGVAVSNDSLRMDVRNLSCVKVNSKVSCFIVEY
jgi:hypothetical protein